jgi:deoxycytidine triphosphate deaminase
MQLNPEEVIRRKIISRISNKELQVQQVGIDLTLSSDVSVRSRDFINIAFSEKFDMQDNFGLVFIRSSLSRNGIFISSGVYDSGFKGIGGVTIYNFSDKTLNLLKGCRIAQMIVFKADSFKLYAGHYNESESVESKMEL